MVDVNSNLAAQKYANMAKNIADIKPVNESAVKLDNAEEANFAGLVEEGIRQTIAAQRKSESMSAKAVVGEADMTDVVESITRAELALDTVMAVRDRMLTAFQEIMRTQI